MGWLDSLFPQVNFDDPQALAQYMQRQQAGNFLGNIGQSISNGARWWEPSGSQPQPQQLNPLQMLLQSAMLRKMNTEQRQTAQQEKAFYGPMSTEMGGKPWAYPGAEPGVTEGPGMTGVQPGQQLTGGLLDQFTGPLAPYRQAFAAAGPEKGSSALLSILTESLKPKPGFELSPGQVRYDASGKEVASLPAAPEYRERDLPIAGDKIQKQISRDKGMRWENVGEPYDRREPFMIQEVVGDDGVKRQVVIPKSALGATPQPISPETAKALTGLPAGSRVIGEKPAVMTEAQGNAALFADRMAQANAVLSELEGEGTNPWARLKSALPGGNYLQSPEYQKFDQAQRDFVNATLRRESGAMISEAEFANAKLQYFPQPGDSKPVIEQKRHNRETALQGIARAAGSSYKLQKIEKSSGVPAPPPGFRIIP